VKKLTELAIIPKRGSEFAAGFDLSSAYDVIVPARGNVIISFYYYLHYFNIIERKGPC